MESVIDDVLQAIDLWLNELEEIEGRLSKLACMKARINRTITQVQMEGSMSLTDMGRLDFIGKIWTEIIDLLLSEKTDSTKKLLVKQVLQLFDSGELSLCITIEMIIKIFEYLLSFLCSFLRLEYHLKPGWVHEGLRNFKKGT